MHLSLRWRLAAGIVLAFAVTLTVIFFTVQFALQRILTNDLDDRLAVAGETIQARILLWGLDDPGLDADVQRYAGTREGNEPFITVVRDSTGEVKAITAGVQPASLPLSEEQRDRVLAGETLRDTVDVPGDLEFRVRTERVNAANGEVAIVQVARFTEGVVSPTNTLLSILIPEGIVATILAVGAAIWLSRGAVRPLQKVIDVAAEIQASDLRRRIHAERQPAEVQKLADTFDAMLERLEKAFQEQQHFIMDVSHELRTPLTVLKGNIDVMLMDKDLDPAAREQYERMSSEVSRLIRLTTNLLYMAGADAGREPERRLLELDVVCLEVVRQGRDLRSDVKLGIGREDQVTVMGDRDQVKQMVLNLVENALKYTPSGGQVTLSVYKNGSDAHVRVEDTGPGIPADILPNIFRRFYRGNQRGMMGGTGLGLAIAE
ncbi:MAG TPA: ATP-binding protein, partial [Dehalococcoidia bacterium]|nr:ATP-binding protein [Dehalococcoidia bacterium]